MKDREIPVETSYNVTTFDILIDGKVVDQGYQILSISVSKEINRIPTAKIVLKDGDAAEETFKISEEEEFLPGKSITVKIGRDSENKQLFKGIIVKHAIKVQESGETRLILDCKDEAVKMTIGRHNYYYEESKDSEIIEEIIGRYSGLSHDVEATTIKYLEMVQYHATDWDFLLMRSEANAKLVVVDDGKITVEEPKTDTDAAVAVLFGSTLIDFEAEMDAQNQWASVEAKSWDYGAQNMFEHTTDSVPVNELGNVNGQQLSESISPDIFELRHSGQAIAEELQEWTKSVMQKSRLSKIRGRAKFIGFSDIKPGQLIELQGLGARFTGKAYVSGIRQDVYNGSWYTQVQFGVHPDCYAHIHKDVADAPASGLVPPINGMQIGKVVQLEEDPEGEHRVLVRLPIINNSARGVWARIATLDAGKADDGVTGRGSFFRPEIEDEVIVGFINDDPRDAVILGMLHSSAKPAPITAEDVNHEKGFVTRSGMRLLFHDKTKTITIDTPAGNSIVIDEDTTSITIKDQNNNSVVLDPAGIEVKSPGDIKIKADGNINIKAGKNMTLEATQITAKASAAMEVKGATTKVSADGITEIKGSLVNIN